MKCKKLFFLLLFVAISGCDCDGSLQRTCPEPVECWVEPRALNIERNFVTENFPRIAERGACELGMTACDSEGNLFCDGIVRPSEETCNHIDDDCDGLIDEGYDKDGDGYTSCGGDCDDSTSRRSPGIVEVCDGLDNDCKDGIPLNETRDADGDGVIECFDCDDTTSARSPNIYEICDGIDNDCDGEIDENVSEMWNYCGESTIGACTRVPPTCLSGELYCLAILPSAEACDGIDNDCDGAIDEDLIQECSNECGIGIEFCVDGGWIGCNAPVPSTEVCDGFDNDCDGVIDEDCSCIPGDLELCKGDVVDPDGKFLNCGVGLKECQENGEFGDCVWVANQPEECNNYDDDCDGEVDKIIESCGDPEYAGIGVCKLGERICEVGLWTECMGNVEPNSEICDDLDNDCDGEVDENLNSHEKVDIVFLLDQSGSMCQFFESLAMGMGEYVSDFEESEHKFGIVLFPGQISQVEGNIPWILGTDLVDVNSFISMLNSLECGVGGEEPSYDTLYDLAHSNNPAEISWREDAYPYLILVTDEMAQSWRDLNEADVAFNTSNCTIGACEPGDSFEVYIITKGFLFYQWNDIVFGEYERLISIIPANAEEYANKLRNIFTNVCL